MLSAVVTAGALADLPQGWFNHGPQVLGLVAEHRPVRCVELGTWRGASAIAFARVMSAWGGTLTCVDTWMGDAYGRIAPGAPQMLAECAANVVAAGVASRVRFLVAPTVDAGRAWTDGPIDFLYVDADHGEAAVADDLAAWWPHLRVGGLIAGDDYFNSDFPGVTQAWDAFEREHDQAFIRTPNNGMALIHGVKQ